MASFQHLALLSENHFRVLHLHPSKSAPSILVFDLEEVIYTDSPAYSAISYTWDGQSLDVDALCNNAPFRITKNCSRILKRLRRSDSTITIWMDQICIDQGSDEDKSMNVRRMDEIYMKSAEVLIWLSGIRDATVRRLQCAEEEYQRSMHLNNEFEFTPPEMDYSWFKRMWTLQEAVVPTHNRILLLAGSERVPLFNAGFASDNRSISWLREIQSHVRFSAEVKPLYTLSDLLHIAIDRGCYDPRDKIFAMYGIIRRIPLKDLGIGNNAGVPFPTPDYRKTVAQVYMESTLWALSKGDMEILKLAALSDSQRAKTQATVLLPSWVPDLARIARAMRDCPHLQRARDPLIWNIGPRRQADPGKHTMPLYDSSNDSLVIVGTRAGTVIMTSQELPEFLRYEYNLWDEPPMRRFLEVCAMFMEETRTTPFKLTNYQFAELFEYSSVFNIILSQAFWMNDWTSTGSDLTKYSFVTIERIKMLVEPGEPITTSWDKFRKKGLPEYHTMFLTSEGYLGISVGTPHVDDNVVIMESMEQLLLLRDAEEEPNKCYRLVGTADVPKLQKQRRLDDKERDEEMIEGMDEQTFILI